MIGLVGETALDLDEVQDLSEILGVDDQGSTYSFGSKAQAYRRSQCTATSDSRKLPPRKFHFGPL